MGLVSFSMDLGEIVGYIVDQFESHNYQMRSKLKVTGVLFLTFFQPVVYILLFGNMHPM